jgi:hypothetical protein
MPKYKPMLIKFNQEGYDRLCETASKKRFLYSRILEWCKAHGVEIEESSHHEFNFDIVRYFKEHFKRMDDHIMPLEGSNERFLNLMDCRIDELIDLAIKYYSIRDIHPITSVGEEGIEFPVHKEQFNIYTRSAKQNAILRSLTSILEQVEKLSDIFPYSRLYAVRELTGGLVNYTGIEAKKWNIDHNLLWSQG